MEITVTIDHISTTSTVSRETVVDLLRIHGVDGVKECLDTVAEYTLQKYKKEME